MSISLNYFSIQLAMMGLQVIPCEQWTFPPQLIECNSNRDAGDVGLEEHTDIDMLIFLSKFEGTRRDNVGDISPLH